MITSSLPELLRVGGRVPAGQLGRVEQERPEVAEQRGAPLRGGRGAVPLEGLAAAFALALGGPRRPTASLRRRALGRRGGLRRRREDRVLAGSPRARRRAAERRRRPGRRRVLAARPRRAGRAFGLRRLVVGGRLRAPLSVAACGRIGRQEGGVGGQGRIVLGIGAGPEGLQEDLLAVATCRDVQNLPVRVSNPRTMACFSTS